MATKNNNEYGLVNIGPIMIPIQNADPNIPGSYGYIHNAYDNMNNFEFHSGSNMFKGFSPHGCGIELQCMRY